MQLKKIKLLNKGDNEEANQGWADAMARILQKELPENKVSEFNELTCLRLHVIIKHFLEGLALLRRLFQYNHLKKGENIQ